MYGTNQNAAIKESTGEMVSESLLKQPPYEKGNLGTAGLPVKNRNEIGKFD
jgi:hypothetical protein